MAKIRLLCQSLFLMGLLLGLGAKVPNAAAPPTFTPVLPATPGPALAPAAEFIALARPQQIPDTFDLVGENELFQLYANQTTLAFKVVDKRSGYVWHSNLDEKGEEDRLNKTWTAFAQSGISLDYLDAKAISERVSISNSENTIDFQKVDGGFAATVTFLVPDITVGVNVTLEPDGVRVDIPADSLREGNPEFKLGLMYVYPFFAATRGDTVPGYMFIPDGAGSLIRFAAATKAKNMFYGSYYGDDLGMIAVLPWDPTINRPYTISIPVLGMVHGEKENAYISIVEKGASYGELHAHPSGIITNFNFLYSAFIYNESYFQATNRSGAGVTRLQPETNQFDVTIHYRFLTGEAGDYVGMARSYQQYLVEKGILPERVVPNDNIGIKLEFLGSEKEKVLFWHRSIPMTTVAEMGAILADLNVQDPEVVYYGWQPRGASSMPPQTLRLDGTLGSVRELQEVIEGVAAANGHFYLYLDPQAALWEESGYSERRDLAMSITTINLLGFNRGKLNYYLNYDALSDHYTSLSSDVFGATGAGLALDGIGSMLYSDFKKNHILNREETIQAYQTLLTENGGSTAFYLPNDYLFGQMQAYYDIPLGNSGYLYTTEVVPFLQIVFAGYVPVYGPPLNFSSNLQSDLLRHADYGVYPSYFLSQELTAQILNTPSNWIYTSSYGQWGDEIETTYQWLNHLLGPVEGAHIVARETLIAGVVATTYDNGYQIIVNYNHATFSQGTLTVSGRDAIVREVEP